MLRARRGRMLDPALVDAIVPLEGDGGFWSLVRDGDWKAAVDALEPPDRVLSAGDERLDRVAEAFARVIDAKSPYTLGHSMRVAAVADAIAARLDRGAPERRDLHRAALLHDLGKLGVPSSILDSPRSLTEREWRIVRRHRGPTRTPRWPTRSPTAAGRPLRSGGRTRGRSSRRRASWRGGAEVTPPAEPALSAA